MISPASGPPFDDIRALLAKLPAPDATAVARVRARGAALANPAGALGRLEELVEWLAAWQGRAEPAVNRPLVAVFAGSHGLAARGVSLDPAVTRQMIETVAAGGGAINQLCLTYGLGLKVFDLALDLPTRDIAEAPALEEAECAATMAFGMEAIAGVDLLCVGAVGAGGATAAAALCAAVFGDAADDWADAAPVAAVAAALARHQGHLRDPLEAMRRLGGREIAAIAGAILAARLNRVPVIVDGSVATAAAAVLHALDPTALDHCLFAHASTEPGHARALAGMGKTALLDLGIGAGDGTGAAITAGIVKAAAAAHAGMTTARSTPLG